MFSRVLVRDGAGRDRFYLPDNYVHSAEINLLAYNLIHPMAALFRRQVFQKIEFEPTIRKYEDTLFFNRVCFEFQTAYLPMAAGVWMQDGRPDQLTRVFYDRNFRNFKIVCHGLDSILRRNPQARRKYLGRLAFQALRCRLVLESVKAGLKAIGV